MTEKQKPEEQKDNKPADLQRFSFVEFIRDIKPPWDRQNYHQQINADVGLPNTPSAAKGISISRKREFPAGVVISREGTKDWYVPWNNIASAWEA